MLPILLLVMVEPSGGGTGVLVSGRPGQTCRLLASPDLENWMPVATNQFNSRGVVLFHDAGGAGQAKRFYRAVMP
jgi:hypothetical protein